MVQTVYVALAGVAQEGQWVLGVTSTVEKAQAVCEKDHGSALQWRGWMADHAELQSQYYEVKGCVVDG